MRELPPCDAAAGGAPGAVPAGWERIDLGPFSLALPPDYRELDSREIDSYVRQYAAPGRRLGFDYGGWSDPLVDSSALADYRACREEIGGRLARVVTGRASDGTLFAGAAWRELPPHLSLTGRADTRSRHAEALVILRSTRFKDR